MGGLPPGAPEGGGAVSTLRHLVRRAVSSWSNAPLRPGEDERARACLSPAELGLWEAMQPRDRRHSLEVHARFAAMWPTATRAELAAALLHDVGKTVSGLGWAMRVVATVVGPRGGRLAAYHDHERLGAAMLDGVSDARTVELVAGSVRDEVHAALCRADDI